MKPLLNIEKRFGKGSIMRWANARFGYPGDTNTSLILTGDRIGGVPRGRIVEIYARRVPARPPRADIVAEAQKAGGVALNRRGTCDALITPVTGCRSTALNRT